MAGPNLANLPCLGFTIDKGMAITAKIKQAKMDFIVSVSVAEIPRAKKRNKGL